MSANKQKDSHRPPSDDGMAKEEFIRVGTTLYKIVEQPKLNGGYVRKRIVWNNETLRQDSGKDYIGSVPKYDGFCTVPEHLNYRPIVGKFLNLYEPIDHHPKEGDFSYIRSLVRHIFGEQYELGMDYLQLLYLQPIQKLPIPLLVSEERNTGKSTFLNFLKLLFQNNVTFNTNEDFRSRFNFDWAGKLLIVVDEVLLNRREDSERLKNLSTTLSYKVEAKGKDRDKIAFFAKFVLCSNNEYLPVIIDAGETRYWVRKIDRCKPVRLYAHHREHRRREQRERGNRRTQAIRHRRLSVRQDVEPHNPCAFLAGQDATGVGGCHRLAWQNPERGTGRVPNRLRRHHQIG